jgi:hypothetical protein
MTDPPSLSGAVHETVAEPFAFTAVGIPGALGSVEGFVTAEGAVGGPYPLTFPAFTTTVYEVPLVRPVMVQVTEPRVEHEPPRFPFKSLAVAAYCVMAEPPVDVGAVQLTMTEVLPPVTETLTGDPGVVEATAAPDGADAGEVPPAKLATTVKV